MKRTITIEINDFSLIDAQKEIIRQCIKDNPCRKKNEIAEQLHISERQLYRILGENEELDRLCVYRRRKRGVSASNPSTGEFVQSTPARLGVFNYNIARQYTERGDCLIEHKILMVESDKTLGEITTELEQLRRDDNIIGDIIFIV